MKIGKNVKIKYSNPQKEHPWRKTRLISVSGDDSSAGATCRRAEEKKEKKKDTWNSGKLAIRPDHPRRRIKIKLCMVGGLWCVVLMSSVIQIG